MSDSDNHDIPESFFADLGGDDGSNSNSDESVDSKDMINSIFGPIMPPKETAETEAEGKDVDAKDGSDDGLDLGFGLDVADRPVTEASSSSSPRKDPKEKAKKQEIVGDEPTASSSSAPTTAKAKSLAPDVREAGRKARLRLEEEKSKRKEIVRIDDEDGAAKLLKDKTSSADGGSKKKRGASNIEITATAKKRKRPAKKRAAALASKSPILDEQEDSGGGIRIDSWMPDATSIKMEGRSKLVRVHGLPLGCKPEDLRRFFTGLSPVRVFVLPSYYHKIDEWDCEGGADITRRRRRGAAKASSSQDPFIKRYPSTFRVFARFVSAPSAEMALKRSGEAVYTTNATLVDQTDADTTDVIGDTNKKKIGAAVLVAPVSKAHATFFMRQLAIDGSKGESLQQTIEDVETHLPTFVTRILWALSWSTLKINHAFRAQAFDDDATKFADAFAILEKRKSTSFPTDAASYRELALAYNSLCDLYETVEQASTVDLDIFAHDPTLRDDPICRLTGAALDWLSEEAERVNLILHHARETLT